jgi:hypothetical protein
LLRAVVSRLEDNAVDLPGWTLDEVQMAGLATGLTALAGSLGLFDHATDDIVAFVAEQREQVGARTRRFASLLPSVLLTLHDAAVPAVAVKGAALLQGVWGMPGTRPMADIDLIVPAVQRAQAAAALVCAGLRPIESTSYEDAFLAWGDGGVGRTDGESADHNGRVELHPGWSEFLHGYAVNGFGVESAPFDHEALTTHVLGHLSSTVVRAEVRAVNVVDVWWCARYGLDWNRVTELMAATDPRLTAPALWLVRHVMPEFLPASTIECELRRLRRPARHALAAATPADVLRDPTQRTSVRWRQAFTMRPSERIAVLDQMLWPHGPRSIRAAAQRFAGRR